MTARVSQAIQSAGGSILDSRFFSNLTLFIRGEVGFTGVGVLREALLATSLNFAPGSILAFDAQIEQRAESALIPFYLVVTFIHSEPDLRITVPAVPG